MLNEVLPYGHLALSYPASPRCTVLTLEWQNTIYKKHIPAPITTKSTCSMLSKLKSSV
jgi:hypothetical protein